MEFQTDFGKRIVNDYASFLNACQMPADTQGCLYVQEQGAWLPMTIKQRRLVLPTTDWLRQPNWETTIPFHPFSEHLSKGKSVVLERTNRIVNACFNTMLANLLTTMAMFAVDTDRHADASAASKEYMRVIPEANKNFATDVRTLMTKHVDDSPERSIISIYLKRGDTIKGVKYDRSAIVSSPLYKALTSENPTVFDFKFSSKKNRGYLVALLEYLLPRLAEPDGYTVGTNSPVAPYFIALLTAFRDLRESLWRHLEALSTVNPDLSAYLTDNTWVDMLENASEVSKELHALRDNTGEDEQGDVKVQAAIVSKEREREEMRERRQNARDGKNVYAERLSNRGRNDEEEQRSRDGAIDEKIPRWRRMLDRRYDDDDDRYEDRRYGRRERDDDRYRDRGRDDYRSDRYRDRDRDRRGRDRDYYDDDDYRDGRTASGIPLDAGTPSRRRW